VSGYLHWLAIQALGRASGVRPARRPPSFGDSAWGGVVAPAAHVLAPADHVLAPANHGERTSAERTSTKLSPSNVDAADRQIISPSAGPAEAAQIGERGGGMPDPRRSPSPPQAEARIDDAADSAVSQSGDARHELPLVRHAQPDPISDRRVAPLADAEHADRPGTDDRLPRTERDVGDEATSSDLSSRHGPIPQALLVPLHSARPVRSRRAAGEPSGQRLQVEFLQADPPAPDVHIHIGRVELTAITPPAAPRRESPANAKKPMSLEEYLHRRSGRSS
jgi:hypothetical protein